MNQNHPASRRVFLKSAAAIGALAALGDASGIARAAALQQRAGATGDRKLKILFLEAPALGPTPCRRRSTRATKSHSSTAGANADLFPDLEKIQGRPQRRSRQTQGTPLGLRRRHERYFPQCARRPRSKTASGVRHDLDDLSVVPAGHGRVARRHHRGQTVEQVTGVTYGPLKALCEQAAEAQMPGRVTNIRPGLIVGPGDSTDRFTYWPVRVAKGGEVLAPGDGSNFIQHIDVRDLGAWIVHCLEKRIVGVYNADSPMRERTIRSLLDTCKAVSRSDAKFVYAPLAFLAEQGIRPWQDMPCYAPAEGDFAAFGQVSSARAIANGLRSRPMADTVRDTLEWWKQQPEERRAKPMRAGLTPEREAKALAAWHARENG